MIDKRLGRNRVRPPCQFRRYHWFVNEKAEVLIVTVKIRKKNFRKLITHLLFSCILYSFDKIEKEVKFT